MEGQQKLAAAARLGAPKPHFHVAVHARGVTAANALALFSGYGVIVDGTDNFPTRYLNNDDAVLARRPLVHGSIFQFEGQVSVFDPARGAPCYRCLFPRAATARHRAQLRRGRGGAGRSAARSAVSRPWRRSSSSSASASANRSTAG